VSALVLIPRSSIRFRRACGDLRSQFRGNGGGIFGPSRARLRDAVSGITGFGVFAGALAFSCRMPPGPGDRLKFAEKGKGAARHRSFARRILCSRNLLKVCEVCSNNVKTSRMGIIF
jgi:hypothetical protein